jgi:L-erythro-3,5-diaminohexanoate dehydrogenase
VAAGRGPELWPDEVRVRVERLNLDAASFRQLREATGGAATDMRAAVCQIVAERGKMQNPVTGSGGMLTGVVEDAGPGSPLGLAPGDRIATLVSLSLTPLVITDGLADWDGRSEQVPCQGHAILFGRSIATVLPADLPDPLALAVLDVCGAPALTSRVVRQAAQAADPGAAGPVVAVLGAAGKSGSLSAAAARRAGAGRVIGVVPDDADAATLRAAGLADEVVITDARDPLALAGAMHGAGRPGRGDRGMRRRTRVRGRRGTGHRRRRHGDLLLHGDLVHGRPPSARRGAAADVTMLIGNGYVPGHARLALDLVRASPGYAASSRPG